MLLNALKFGVLGVVVLPVIAFFGTLAIGHLAGACGPGSSGGCEMGAASLAISALIPGFLIGAALSIIRDLVRGGWIGAGFSRLRGFIRGGGLSTIWSFIRGRRH